MLIRNALGNSICYGITYLNIDEPNILLTVIGLNKFAYINYSFCYRFMNNSVVAFSERTGKGLPFTGTIKQL